uniref:Odorant-binding protein 29 n=1 Tax=Anopheles farauti TaxID=69004 RepID=A0A182QCM5_9DIPT
MEDHRKWISVGVGAVIVPMVVMLLLLLGTSVHPAEALRCRSNEGPSTEDVKRIVRTCLNKITNAGTANRSNDEYPNYDSSASDETEEERGDGDSGRKDEHGKRGANGNKPYFDRRYDERGNGRMNWPDGGEGDRRMQMGNGRNQRNGMDGERTRMGDRTGGRDRADEERQMMMRDYGGGHHRRKRQYHGGQGAPYSSGGGGGGDYANYGRIPVSPYGESTPSSNGSSGGNSSSIERDRACLMQCFFEELKATNTDGFPEKHKVLHVITKDIREHELREFYIDSIQECFHMLGMDGRLKDKCDYSMRFVTCLSDRFQSNCDDWDSITSALF